MLQKRPFLGNSNGSAENVAGAYLFQSPRSGFCGVCGYTRLPQEISVEKESAACERFVTSSRQALTGLSLGRREKRSGITVDPEVDFSAIWAQFDTLLMGRATYDAGRQRLGENAFTGRPCIVFSRTLEPRDYPSVTVKSELSADWARSLKEQPGKDIWLMGGRESVSLVCGRWICRYC